MKARKTETCPNRLIYRGKGNQTSFGEIAKKVWVAETKGFEPSIPFPVYSLSRGAPSTTRPRLRRPVYRHRRGRARVEFSFSGIGEAALRGRCGVACQPGRGVMARAVCGVLGAGGVGGAGAGGSAGRGGPGACLGAPGWAGAGGAGRRRGEPSGGCFGLCSRAVLSGCAVGLC